MTNEAFLRQVALFKDLSENDVRQLESMAYEQSFKRNEVICRLQETESRFHVVTEGTVKVTMQDRSNKEIILYLVRAGGFFGEASLFGVGHQLGTATALEPCRTFVVFRDKLMPFILKHPSVLLTMLSTLSSRLCKAEQRISRLVFADAYEKVASVLEDCLEEANSPPDRGVELSLSLTRKELASMIGVSRETFIRIMTGLQKAGVIRIESRRIAIVNPRKLKREATRSLCA